MFLEIVEWAIHELQVWRENGWRGGDQSSVELFSEMSQQNGIVHIRVSGHNVIICNDSDQKQATPSWQRAINYKRHIQEAILISKEEMSFDMLIDIRDARRTDDPFPVFVFQKPVGINEILIPDVDFMSEQYYVAATDKIPYAAKQCKAVFAGSTTGRIITLDVAKNFLTPRLDAWRFFNDKKKLVTFELPNIVECADIESEQELVKLGVGDGKFLSWNNQLKSKFIISIDGNGATCSRVAKTLKSNSVLLKYISPHILYYFHGLVPWKHYIPISAHTDVLDVLKEESRRPGTFEAISIQANKFSAEMITKSRTMAYTAALLSIYNKIYNSGDSCEKVSGRSSTDITRTSAISVYNSVIESFELAIMQVNLHITNIGDRSYNIGGWMGDETVASAIEGLSIDPGAGMLGTDLTYCSWGLDHSGGSIHGNGDWSGSRGLNKPIFGLCISLRNSITSRFYGYFQVRHSDGTESQLNEFGSAYYSEQFGPIRAIRLTVSNAKTYSTDTNCEAMT